MTFLKQLNHMGVFLLWLLLPMLSARSETLAEVARHTIETHPDVLERVHERQVRDQLAEEARGGLRPKVDFLGEFGYQSTNSPGTRARRRAAGLDDNEFVDLTRSQATLDARQMFYDGNRTVAEVARRMDNADAAAYELRAVAESVARNVAKTYLQVLRERELLELSRQNLLDHQRIHDQIRQRADSGVGRQADLDQADARLALAEANLVASEAKLEDTRAVYARVVGDFPPETMHRPQPARELLPPTVAEAVDQAEKQHPSVLAAEAYLAAAGQNQVAASSYFQPRVEGQLVARYGNDLDGVEGFDQDWIARVNAEYNLFNGFADAARLLRMGALLRQAEDAREAVLREIAERVRLDWNALQSAERRLATLERQVKSTEKARDAYRQQFNLGERSLLDLLDSENELFEARRALAEAREEHDSAIFSLIAGLGRLTEALQLMLPEQAQPAETRSPTW